MPVTETTRRLPDDVLEQAATAFLNEYTTYGDGMIESGKAGINAALPILTEAIETALLNRMIADSDKKADEEHYYWGYEDVSDWLRTYLPTATESEADHE